MTSFNTFFVFSFIAHQVRLFIIISERFTIYRVEIVYIEENI